MSLSTIQVKELSYHHHFVSVCLDPRLRGCEAFDFVMGSDIRA
jgi:hypothetical protein